MIAGRPSFEPCSSVPVRNFLLEMKQETRGASTRAARISSTGDNKSNTSNLIHSEAIPTLYNPSGRTISPGFEKSHYVFRRFDLKYCPVKLPIPVSAPNFRKTRSLLGRDIGQNSSARRWQPGKHGKKGSTLRGVGSRVDRAATSLITGRPYDEKWIANT